MAAILVVDSDYLMSLTVADMLRSRGHDACALTQRDVGQLMLNTGQFSVLIIGVDEEARSANVFVADAKAKHPNLFVIGIIQPASIGSVIRQTSIDLLLRPPFTVEQLDRLVQQRNRAG
jgi:DNA-binding NtrC family response regulator